MSYNWLKLIHVVTASILIASLGYSYQLWRNIRSPNQLFENTEKIQLQTWTLILPMAILQLMSGFTMISLKHYPMSQLWISGSIVGFVLVIGSWFGFIYFLLQQVAAQQHSTKNFSVISKFNYYRQIQSTFLLVCLISLLSMIFFMANKIP